MAESAGIGEVREAVRDVRPGAPTDSLQRDFRFGLRLLGRNRAFTAAALLMLAIGVGANTAVFSFLNSLVFRGLPYAEPGSHRRTI